VIFPRSAMGEGTWMMRCSEHVRWLPPIAAGRLSSDSPDIRPICCALTKTELKATRSNVKIMCGTSLPPVVMERIQFAPSDEKDDVWREGVVCYRNWVPELLQFWYDGGYRADIIISSKARDLVSAGTIGLAAGNPKVPHFARDDRIRVSPETSR
jgi:hypothetical protein